MELPSEKLIDALSLTRERVRVWVSENLSLQKFNNTQQKDRHPLPALSHKKWERASVRTSLGSYMHGTLTLRTV